MAALHPSIRTLLLLHAHAAVPAAADTFATVLLPEEDVEGWQDEQQRGTGGSSSTAQPAARRGSSSGRLAGGGGAVGEVQGGGEEEEEVVPLSAQVQARLEGLTLQLDTFDPAAAGLGAGAGEEGGAATRTRLALRLHTLEVRDSFQPRKGGGGASAAAAAATGWAELRRTLGYHASPHRARGAGAAMVQLAVEGVAAGPGAGGWLLARAARPCARAALLAGAGVVGALPELGPTPACLPCSLITHFIHRRLPTTTHQSPSTGWRRSCCRCWRTWTRQPSPSWRTFSRRHSQRRHLRAAPPRPCRRRQQVQRCGARRCLRPAACCTQAELSQASIETTASPAFTLPRVQARRPPPPRPARPQRPPRERASPTSSAARCSPSA